MDFEQYDAITDSESSIKLTDYDDSLNFMIGVVDQNIDLLDN